MTKIKDLKQMEVQMLTRAFEDGDSYISAI